MHRSASGAIHGESDRIAVHIALVPHGGTRRALTYGADLLDNQKHLVPRAGRGHRASVERNVLPDREARRGTARRQWDGPTRAQVEHVASVFKRIGGGDGPYEWVDDLPRADSPARTRSGGAA